MAGAIVADPHTAGESPACLNKAPFPANRLWILEPPSGPEPWLGVALGHDSLAAGARAGGGRA